MTFDDWLKTTNISENDTLLYNWGKTVWEEAYRVAYEIGYDDGREAGLEYARERYT